MRSALVISVYAVLCYFLLSKIWLAKLLVVINCVYVGRRLFRLTTSQRIKRKSLHPWKYDVFLSFTGETRKGFTHFLYKTLQGRGLSVFRDQELERGTNISLKLLTAIEESRFAIVVLSPKYASSTWCLDELSKIFECMEVRGTILPIFYKVKPSNVRNQRGRFAKAFNKHEYHNMAKVQRWRSVLTKVGCIAGWISKDWYESELIDVIVESVYNAS
ncbi:disease resistance protein RUN1-like [Rosa rugosa]|uniref:disease resistance protein RUN1-like n=1 Tax=Rosa rugosa TaxID=74645 RepID=UPI002B406097|nr:disease resistance protein RUN1-like [Rosa rugosa]